MIDVSQVTRVEVITEDGAQTFYPARLYVDVQDNGKTLKIVVRGHDEFARVAHHKGLREWFGEWIAREDGHKTTAANCRFWTGDNGAVDWGTCWVCEEEEKR